MMSKQNTAFNIWCAELGSLMRTVRSLNGLGLREYAKKLKMSPATLSRIERGYGCDMSTLLHIHEATGISVHGLVCGLHAKKE